MTDTDVFSLRLAALFVALAAAFPAAAAAQSAAPVVQASATIGVALHAAPISSLELDQALASPFAAHRIDVVRTPGTTTSDVALRSSPPVSYTLRMVRPDGAVAAKVVRTVAVLF